MVGCCVGVLLFTSFEEHTSTHAQGTDPRVALGAEGELPWIYLDALGNRIVGELSS